MSSKHAPRHSLALHRAKTQFHSSVDKALALCSRKPALASRASTPTKGADTRNKKITILHTESDNSRPDHNLGTAGSWLCPPSGPTQSVGLPGPQIPLCQDSLVSKDLVGSEIPGPITRLLPASSPIRSSGYDSTCPWVETTLKSLGSDSIHQRVSTSPRATLGSTARHLWPSSDE